MTNKNNTTSKANTTNTKAAETIYTKTARATLAIDRAISSKALTEFGGMDTKEARAAYPLYLESMTALVIALADCKADIANTAKPSDAHASALISAASRFVGYFAADKAARVAALFEGKNESNIIVATRITAAIGDKAVNGLTKNIDGLRRGSINVSGKNDDASAPARKALEQWAIDAIDTVPAMDAAALINDRKAKAAKRAAAKAAKAEQAKQAEQVKPAAKNTAIKAA